MAITNTDARRRSWLHGAAGIAFAGALPVIGFAHGAAAHIEMWSDEGCACCNHLQNYQFDVGSPSMERARKNDPYQVLLIGLDANATVFKSYF